MIYKKRKIPTRLQALLALDRRLPLNHPLKRQIAQQIYDRQAGFAGELEYDKYLKEFRPSYPHAILHDVTLRQDGIYFQIDSVLITPNEVILSEIKNIAGRVIVKPNPLQFIKESPTGERAAMRNPVTELERKTQLLTKWMRERRIDMPIRCLVVFAYENELVIDAKSPVDILFTYDVPIYLRQLDVQQHISSRQLHTIARAMKQSDCSFITTPLAQTYKLDPAEIKPGIQCQHCDHTGMRWNKGTWHCPKCQHLTREGHVEAITDWFLLMDNKLTNQQFCNFIGAPNRHIARRLLMSSGLQLVGIRKSAHYVRKQEQEGEAGGV
ncbi:nuclease-related domain-containing protein [Sporosarcina sp. Te-1]|uniref:nuclease-related domain-containing protein n=1 Tax=Sporosarcina sp. Te-1 TaxID=2818390 RepID=UPI001A9E78BB|nr:nuclease-related domain-containing protein [Sporosarcina sp. Te-1]QTD40794.1 NERD domain-containing protein [Sporosarcina sp. Te-1]